MIVNLPNWTTVTNGVEPWVSGLLNSFAPAVYWEIGLAVGVGIILFVWAVVGGGLRSLLGAFGSGSDPMRGIPGGNSGVAPMRGGIGGGRSNFRVGGVGHISARMAKWGTLKGSGIGPKTKDTIIGMPYLNNLENQSRNMRAAEKRKQALLKEEHKGDSNYA